MANLYWYLNLEKGGLDVNIPPCLGLDTAHLMHFIAQGMRQIQLIVTRLKVNLNNKRIYAKNVCISVWLLVQKVDSSFACVMGYTKLI